MILKISKKIPDFGAGPHLLNALYKVQLTCTDLPGVEGLRSMWPHFITNDIDGIVFVIDAHRVLTDYEYLLDQCAQTA